MNKNKIAAWLGVITLAVSLVACGDKEVVSEMPVVEEAVTQTDEAAEAGSQAEGQVNATEIFGEVVAIGENEITVAAMQMPMGGAPGEMPEGGMPEGEAPEGMPEKPEGEAAQDPGANGEMPQRPEGEAPEGAEAGGKRMERPEGADPGAGGKMKERPEGGAPGEMPEGEMPEGEAPEGMPKKPEGEAPQDPGANGEMPQGEGFTGGETEEKVIALSDSTKFIVDGEEATINEIQVGDMVVIIMDGEQAASVEVRDMQPGGMASPDGAPGKPEGGAGGGDQSGSVETQGVTEITEESTQTDVSFSSEESDISAVVVTDGGSLSLSATDIRKTGDVSDKEASEFYGLNAALLVKSGSSAAITDSSVTTDALGANAVFATGENAKIEVSNVTIETKGDSSRGLDATYGGTVIGDNVTITTQGAHGAALATDRGEGTIQVTNGTFQTSGEGSPCIYSTGDIRVTDSQGLATDSSIAVVEGKNSIYVEGCTLESYGIGRAGGGIDDAGVMVYQSMSGDAGVGTGNFTAVNSSLSISEESDKYVTSPMFFVTNTDAVIELTNTELNFGSGILLSATGNDGEWGKAGENGGDVQMNINDQTAIGDVVTDALSSVALTLTNSTLEGCINSEDKGDVTLILDSDSTWNVTGDSYVTVLTNEDKTCSNIISNGYRIYYDADNSVNDWLNGESISLSGGGMLMPAN